jgi:hypothetical protein
LQLCDVVNAGGFVYSPFYYVLDNTSDEFEVRAYHLDNPKIADLDFIAQNSSTAVTVNTKSYSITRREDGYEILVEVSSDEFYKQLEDIYVFAQMSFVPVGELHPAYINGELLGKNGETGERIFRFYIESSFDIDEKHQLAIKNFQMFDDETVRTFTPLNAKFTILYGTTSVPVDFVNDDITNKLGMFLLEEDSVGITEERISVNFGSALSNLWSRSRSVVDGGQYEVYETDVPAVYEEDIYERDPVTGAALSVDGDGNVVYTILHRVGDPMLDSDEQQIWKHRAGDVKLDASGQPIAISNTYTSHHIDLLLVDGSYYFTSDTAYQEYRAEIALVFETWITQTLSKLQTQLLEQTEIFFYPTSAVGMVPVLLSHGLSTSIEAKQSFQVTLYVPSTVYADSRIRKQLETTSIQTLNKVLKNKTISISDMVIALREACGNSVVTASVQGLGGKFNYETVTLLNDHNSLSINKVLAVQDDGALIVAEDVDISFVEYTAK